MTRLVRRKRVDNQIEKKILIGLITSDKICNKLLPIVLNRSFNIPYFSVICKWIDSFYTLYEKAPASSIEDIFENEKRKLDDEETKLIQRFLISLSEDYEYDLDTNEDFFIDKAIEYIDQISIKKLAHEMLDLTEVGRTQDAKEAMANHRNISVTTSGWSNPFDPAEINDSMEMENDILFRFPGALGDLSGDFLRGQFCAYLAPIKRGKCLRGDSKITLSDGRIMSLEDVINTKTKNIITLDNKTKKFTKAEICDFWDNGVKKCYDITTRTGRKVPITANHPLFDFDKGWLSIDDGLSVGDHIAVPKKVAFFGNKKIPVDHVRILAYLLADGCLTGGEITFTKKEKELKNDVIRIITDLGDKHRRIDELSIAIGKGFKSPKPPKTKTLLRAYNVEFCKSIRKTIPDCIFTLPKPLLREFINKLFTCDGSIFDFSIEYSSGSEKLIRQLHSLLLRFGIVSKVRSKLNKQFDRTYWGIYIRDSENIKAFIKNIGFSFKKEKVSLEILKKLKKNRSFLDGIPFSYRSEVIKKIKESGIRHKAFKSVLDMPNSKSKITRGLLRKVNKVLNDKEINDLLNDDILYDEIISIDYVGEEKTYDISVPEHHNFIANDVCVHNTWFLIEMATTAMTYGLKVLFISLEMDRRQMNRRFYKRVTSAPDIGGPVKYPCFDCQKNQDNSCQKPQRGNKVKLIDNMGRPLTYEKAGNYEPCTYCRYEEPEEYIPSSWFTTIDRPSCTVDLIRKNTKAFGRTFGNNNLRTLSYPRFAAGMDQLETDINILIDVEEFVPDVILTDYVDIFLKDSKGDFRNAVDRDWMAHARLAAQYHCLVATVSQSNKASWDKKAVKASDTSENYRNPAHVDKFFTLNQTPEEKRKGVMRVIMAAARNEDFDSQKACILLQSFGVGQPLIDSEMEKIIR